ncbi:Gfo/Idh/MocA family oxidoreductase [Mycolicibacterium sp. S2-37]|uniref:Gfo/Idh/MocA family protein n=1 Tax=Mycolicibacterium sp. S2-37 TaxID=2810297 RepID=UPI001A940E6B|nr:Gfo/Idh/MocA family oxidoreductase [Mycolicibacterium sp. S2-37]MBO0678655.1 Gfo/Idh/MocA family oxidoreductase [Mycolicibacterium sp. S2-37]
MTLTAHGTVGLAIIGCGTVGRIRARLAREYPGIGWLGLCDVHEQTLKNLEADTDADFATTDLDELLARPEVGAVIIATDEQEHVEPILKSVERGVPLFIEKPLATNPVDSARVLAAIEAAGVDAVVGYTQRFRRRFQTVKQRLRDGQIGDVTTVVTRAFMNRMVPEATLRKVADPAGLTPMVVSGTHSLDMSMWLMEGRKPVEVYARSTDRTLGRIGTKDGTSGIFTMDDGVVFSMNINWALPTQWPGAVYGLEVGIVGTRGVIDIEDTHRDVILASEIGQPAGYNSRGFEPPAPRHVDFVGSYPPGDVSDGMLWGPMREETTTWYSRVCRGIATPHATAADGHANLLNTMAMDLSAKSGKPVALPVDPDELLAGLGY